MAEPPLYCNACWNKAQNKAFKTSCDHCFCEQCANQLFNDHRRRCGVCNIDVTSVLEFQVVGAPILDDQLTEVRSTLQAIACANGASSIDSWLSSLHRFERVQLVLWGSRQNQASMDSLREAEERERALSERELQSRQLVASLEHECEQIRKERDSAQRSVQDLQMALDERSRQADNWRAMYEALKTGGRVSIPHNSSSSSIANGMGAPPTRSMASSAILPGPSNKLLRPATSGGYYDQNSRYAENSSNNGNNYMLSSNSLNNQSLGMSRAASGSVPENGQQNSSRFRSSSILSMDSNNSAMEMPRIPVRSSSVASHRPPTRDLNSLLNRSVMPRSSGTFSGRSLGPPPQISEPVRSTFFAPSSIRGASPSMTSLQLHGGGGAQGSNGSLY